MDLLATEELSRLIERVFRPAAGERTLAILIDLPDGALPDRDSWRVRRALAAGWVRELRAARHGHGLEVGLYGYRNV